MEKKSWLVQRLRKPRGGTGLLADNVFSFGGGLVNGGLSPDAMALIRPLMSFDYMGAAEFEFGAVPKAFQTLAKADELAAFTMTIRLSLVPPHWSVNRKDDTPPDGNATIYVLCPKAWGPEAITRISEWARGKEDLKERTHLTSTLRPHHDWDGETVGWLEISNGFFFATDREMWEGVCRLFGVDTTAARENTDARQAVQA